MTEKENNNRGGIAWMVMNVKLALNVIACIFTKEGDSLQEGLHCDWEPDYFIFLLDPESNILKGIVVLKNNENRFL